MTRPLSAALRPCVALLLLVPSPASSQPETVPPASAPSPPPPEGQDGRSAPAYPVPGEATNGWDVVVTADNRVLYVRVIKQEPGSFVTFQNPDGRQETLAWSMVKAVALVPNSPGAAPPPPPGSPPSSASQIDPRTGRARLSSTRDCSRSDDERCREQSSLVADGQGVRFGLQGERVTRVKTPPKSDLGWAIEVSGLYGTSTGDELDFSIWGYGLQTGLRMMFGGQFPGPGGGSWSGVGMELMGGLSVGGGSMDAAGQSMDIEQGMFYGAASAGYQYLKFGSMDPQTLKQSGVGIFLGYRFGGQYSSTKVGEMEPSTSSGTTHGPVLTLSFPKYNAGTAKLQRWTVTVMGMYIEDFLFVTAGAGYTW